MMYMIRLVKLSMVILLIASCKGITKNSHTDTAKTFTKLLLNKEVNADSVKLVLKDNLNFFADSLLKGNRAIVFDYMKKYQPDTCGVLTYKDSLLRAGFEGVRAIRSIKKNRKRDSVFIMPPFNYCDEGDSYCFYNQSLPRLYTDSGCCHPDSFFVLQDIDDDGINEVGIFYSSCASRFKALQIYSLKNGRWKEIGSSTFDTFTRDPSKVRFESLIKKISKRRFKICNFVDGKTTWETITMK